MFFEIRQYRTRPGQRDAWVKLMEEQIIPFQISTGMVIVGSFVGQQDEDLYIWIRRFDSDEQRKLQYEAVYESADWKERYSPLIPDLLDLEGTVITRVEPTPKSVIR